MKELKNFKWPIITLVIIISGLMVMIAVGYTIGILSGAPDGLERTLIEINGEKYSSPQPSIQIPREISVIIHLFNST